MMLSKKKHLDIVEIGPIVLAHLSLPPKFCLEVFSLAVYLINRMPVVPHLKISPYEKLLQKSSNYSHLRAFGCLYFSWL